ncbi:integral membrane protein [Ophiostoma piceae UAMH 11346]|uniref:Integral membrane protein n=1 Tax=Ophiostoma piceae (strain UAMH 11346) TaxID=1262450 RepID=S3C065_OPHP1|nr:integral membrane protein [Ophiostoma piceae UAMH 11346]
MAGSSAGEDYNLRLTIGVVVTCLLLAILSFGLRLYARTVSSAKLWYDDYWMILVMVMCFGMSACDITGLVFGSGKHQADLPVATFESFMKNLYAYEIIWSFGVFGVKVGILLFYWRVFPTRRIRMVVLAVFFFSGGIFVINFFTFVLQCLPVSRFWDQTVDGTCINQNQFYFASAIINVCGDVAVLALPMPIVWRLHTSRNKKWSLSFLFLLGAFVFRIVAVREIDPADFTFSNVAGGLWSTVEVEIGFICANLPAIRPLIIRWFKLGSGSTGASNSGYDGYANGGNPLGYGTHSKIATNRSRRMPLGSRNGERDIELMSQGNSSDEIKLTKGVRPASLNSETLGSSDGGNDGNNHAAATRITAGQGSGSGLGGGIRVKTEVQMTVDEWPGGSEARLGEPYGMPG